jgi:hypothetical protein
MATRGRPLRLTQSPCWEPDQGISGANGWGRANFQQLTWLLGSSPFPHGWPQPNQRGNRNLKRARSDAGPPDPNTALLTAERGAGGGLRAIFPSCGAFPLTRERATDNRYT